MQSKTRDLVAVLSDAIIRRIGESRYQLWFGKRVRYTHEGETLVVGTASRHIQEWLEKTFIGAVEEAAFEVFGQPTPVRFVIDPELFQAAREEQARQQPAKAEAPSKPEPVSANKAPSAKAGATPAVPSEPSFASPQKGKHDAEASKSRKTRRWRKLNEFVVGPCNRVAHASALAVVEAPGECANPLVLHGPVGTGKTHLLEGIYASIKKMHSDWRVTYVTSEEFTTRFVQAMRVDKLGSFRKQFRECDVLLLDDLQFLASKKATQEEFLRTFDVLLAEGVQVVLTMDCHPRLSDEFPVELVDRLLGGAVWGLAPPDADTRLAILRQRARVSEFDTIPDEVLVFLSKQLRGNVRELEGAVNSVKHFARVTGRKIDVALCKEALAELLRHAIRVVQVVDVDRAVCSVLRLTPGALQDKGRTWAISHPRMVAMFLARKHTTGSYSDIGAYFGHRNHSTVVAAEKKVRQWLAEDEELSMGERKIRAREVIDRVERELLG